MESQVGLLIVASHHSLYFLNFQVSNICLKCHSKKKEEKEKGNKKEEKERRRRDRKVEVGS